MLRCNIHYKQLPRGSGCYVVSTMWRQVTPCPPQNHVPKSPLTNVPKSPLNVPCPQIKPQKVEWDIQWKGLWGRGECDSSWGRGECEFWVGANVTPVPGHPWDLFPTTWSWHDVYIIISRQCRREQPEHVNLIFKNFPWEATISVSIPRWHHREERKLSDLRERLGNSEMYGYSVGIQYR